MKKEDIKELTTEELRLRLLEEREQYTKMKMNHTISPMDNTMKIREKRRGIARIKTELTVREKSATTNS